MPGKKINKYRVAVRSRVDEGTCYQKVRTLFFYSVWTKLSTLDVGTLYILQQNGNNNRDFDVGLYHMYVIYSLQNSHKTHKTDRLCEFMYKKNTWNNFRKVHNQPFLDNLFNKFVKYKCSIPTFQIRRWRVQWWPTRLPNSGLQFDSCFILDVFEDTSGYFHLFKSCQK